MGSVIARLGVEEGLLQRVGGRYIGLGAAVAHGQPEVDADHWHRSGRLLALLGEDLGGIRRHHDDVERLAGEHAFADRAGLHHGDVERVTETFSNAALVSAITSRMPFAEMTLISAADAAVAANASAMAADADLSMGVLPGRFWRGASLSAIGSILKGIWNGILGLFGWD